MESPAAGSFVKEEDVIANDIGDCGVQDLLKVEVQLHEIEESRNEEGNSKLKASDCWTSDGIRLDVDEIPWFDNTRDIRLLAGDGVRVSFKCGVCSSEAETERALMTHMRSHNRHKVCPICGLVANSKLELGRHLGVHAKEVPHVCEHCHHGFFRLTSLQNHDCRKRPKLCQHCGSSFKTKMKLRDHMKAAHLNEKVPKKRYCHHCEFSCWSGDDINTHLRSHAGNKTLHCPHCTFEFSRLDALQKHMRIHKDETSFSCPYCGAVFAKYGVVKIHMELHKDGQLHHCQHCDFATPTWVNLKSHKSRVHNPNKHKCPHCEYETPAIYRYKVHLLSHEAASHQCDHCDYKTKYKWDLKRHNQTHEKEATNYRCPHCDYTCARLDTLKHHAAKHVKLPKPDFIASL